MSNSSGFECDLVNMWEKFVNLTHTEMNIATRRALRTAAAELVEKTKSNARAGIKSHNNNTHIIYSDNVEDAPRMSKIESERGSELSQKVQVLGSRDKYSQTYKFRFLEKGTRPRYAKSINGRPLKKRRYLGSISPRWYFRDAQNAIEPNLSNIYIREIEKSINKINNTNNL